MCMEPQPGCPDRGIRCEYQGLAVDCKQTAMGLKLGWQQMLQLYFQVHQQTCLHKQPGLCARTNDFVYF